MKDAFPFYKRYVSDSIKNALTENQFWNYLEAVIYCGTNGEYHIEDPIVEAVFSQIKASIIASQKRYQRYIWYGEKGGCPEKYSRHDMVEVIRKYGCYNCEDVAHYLGCSLKTVKRKISDREIEELCDSFRYARSMMRSGGRFIKGQYVIGKTAYESTYDFLDIDRDGRPRH